MTVINVIPQDKARHNHDNIDPLYRVPEYKSVCTIRSIALHCFKIVVWKVVVEKQTGQSMFLDYRR